MDTLQAFLVEQTSPIEVLLFVAVTVAFCLAVAAVVYVSVLVALWALRLRASISLQRLFLPTRGQFREFAGEYLLATATALVLTATLVAKHDLVETIRNYPIDDLSSPAVARLFPLEEPPGELEEHLLRSGTVTAHALLKPALTAGRAQEAKLFVQALVPALRDETLLAHLTRGRLLTAAVVLGILYLFWLGSRRVKELRAVPESEAAPAYGKTVASLLVLALCIALMLATPRLLADTESLAESTLAAVLHHEVPPSEQTFETRAEVLLGEQIALFPNLRLLETAEGVQPENVIELVAEARRAAREVGEKVTRLSEREEEASRRDRDQLEGLGKELDALREQLDALGGRLESLEEELRRVAERALADLEDERRTRREALVSLGARLDALEDLDRRVEGLLERLQALGAGHREDVQDLRQLLQRLQARLGELETLEERLAAIEGRRPTTGSLVVFVHPSRFTEAFRLTGPASRSFTGPAVLGDLPPGTYRVVGSNYRSEGVRVEAGSVQGLTVGAAPPVIQ